MSLYKRNSTWHYDFAVAGQRYRGSTKETLESKARKIESLLISEAESQGITTLLRKAPLLSEFVERFFQWIEAGKLEPKSKLYYKEGWRLLRNTRLYGMRLDQITRDTIETLKFPGSASNTNRALRTIRRMLGKAEEWGLIRSVPKVKLAKEYGRSEVLDRDSEAKLIKHASQPLRDILILMLDTGMRPQEVFRMNWENVDWSRGMIFVPHGKTRNSRRFIPMSQRVSEVLTLRNKGKTEGYVFPSDSKTGYITTVKTAFQSARRKAGLSNSIVLYTARHTFATNTLAATGNLAVVMKAMGHSKAQTAMIYQHPNLETIRQAVDNRNGEVIQRHNSRHNEFVIQ